MSGYADPELLVARWLNTTLDLPCHADPKPPPSQWTKAPWAWVQRSPGGDDLALTLDDVLLDVDVYAANADHARDAANRIWTAMVFQLPLHTFDNGVFVKLSKCTMRPCWLPDPKYKRSATYRLILHGLVP